MSIVSVLCALSWLAPPSTAFDPDSSYRLRLAEAEPLRIAVQATLPSSKSLSMSDYGAWSQARGWASFISDLRVEGVDGDSIAVHEGGAGWRLGDHESDRIELSYTVDLAHVDWPDWPEGPRTTSAFRAPDGGFALVGSLLVFGDRDGSCELSFEGDAWGRVAAPFQKTDSGAFRMESLQLGSTNAIVFRADELTEFSVGGLEVQIATLGGASETDLLAPLVSDALDDFATLFRTRPEGQFLAIVYPDAWDTGEAYTDSFVLATTQSLTGDNVAAWGQSVAHEIFHRWLGKQMRGTSWADSNWFSEGMTDYAASLFLVRAGYVGIDVFLDQLEKHAAFHRLYHKGPPFAGLDLVSAGADKGPNNAAIYDGGWLAAFAIDVLLQQRTNGEVDHEDFLRLLHRFCSEVEGGYGTEDLLQLLNEISGSDFSTFFEQHVRGAEPLGLVDLCAAAGIELILGAEQAHARLDQRASSQARRVRGRLLRNAGSSRPDISDRIHELLTHWDGDERPGLALSVWMDHELVHSEGYGAADLERGQPIEPNTVFHAASVSKQFTAFIVYMLESEGLLSLEDPIEKWFPELSCGEAIRVRHLLDHTSGLRDQWQLLGLRGVRTYGDVVSQDDVLRLLFRQKGLCFQPGTQQAYCNSGYTLLAELAARATGVPFPRLARERIFEPLGMSDTRFQESTTNLIPGRALSYARKPDGYDLAPLALGTYGATGLMTTTEDLVRWSRNAWELDVGSAVLYERMVARGRLEDGTELNFTSGLQVRSREDIVVLGHPGSDAGYRSAVLFAPQARLAVALLANVDSVDMWALPDGVLDLCLGLPIESDAFAESQPAADNAVRGDTATAPDELGPYVGTYYSAEVDTSYELRIVDGVLTAHHIRNDPIPLTVESADALTCDRWFLTALEVERNARGEVSGFRAHSTRSRGVRFLRQ